MAVSLPHDRPSALLALSDALEAELLHTSADEIWDALRESGRAREGVCHKVRSLLDHAITVGEDSAGPVPPDMGNMPGVHRH